ncbi:MAG: hypothetical protein ACK4UJ_09475 [Leptonema sp. (in: bacteria)]
MIKLLFYLVLGYLLYKILVAIIKSILESRRSKKESFYYDEYGNIRQEKDITKEAKILDREK